MAVLPSSGPLSINDIAGVMGGTAPHSLNEYYRGGGLVPSTEAVTVTEGPLYSEVFYLWQTDTDPNSLLIIWDGIIVYDDTRGDALTLTSLNLGFYTYHRGAYAAGTSTSEVSRTYQSTTDINTSVPTSGTISISNFYGAQSAPSWTYLSAFASSGWGARTVFDFVWSGSLLMAVGSSGGVATSPDGINWTNRTGLSSTTWGSTNVDGVVWNGSVFLVYGDSGKIATSPDGINWTYQSGLISAGWSGGLVIGAVWAGDRFVVLGLNSRVATSTNGVSWTLQGNIPEGATGTRAGAIAWTGTHVVAVGSNFTTRSSNGAVSWSSVYPQTFTGGGPDVDDLIWDGSNLVFVTGGRYVYASADGISWTNTADLGGTSYFSTIGATSSKIYVGGYSGYVAYADKSNLASWTIDSSLRSTAWGGDFGVADVTAIGGIGSRVVVGGTSARLATYA